MKKLMTAVLSLCLAAGMAVPAFALDYSISAPYCPDYAKATSVEVIYTADGGAEHNADRSKNAALIPPAFGSPSAYAPVIAEYLTPNLAPNAMAATGAVINGGTPVTIPASADGVTVMKTQPAFTITASTSCFTDVTDDLYYSGGYLAALKIPAIGMNVKVYQGTDNATLARGAGHFEETSIWNGNVAIAGHNRGANCVFG